MRAAMILPHQLLLETNLQTNGFVSKTLSRRIILRKHELLDELYFSLQRIFSKLDIQNEKSAK